MLIDTLKLLFERDLAKLQAEIGLYTNENNLWVVANGTSNPAGNLCLHLVGNLNAFIGATLGQTNYERNRELEFSARDIPKLQLIKMVAETNTVVKTSLERLDESSLKKQYPVLVFAEKTTVEYMLVHLLTHLAYHLGQVNYHRRMIDIK